MPDDAFPTPDPVAAGRWMRTVPKESPWLHEEVGRRMEERLQWMRRVPARWADWEPLNGGLQAHGAVRRRYPQADCHLVESQLLRAEAVSQALRKPWWSPARWQGGGLHMAPPHDASVDLVWANMLLHHQPDPAQMLARWHRALTTDGFLMFSCLGPDSLRSVRGAWAGAGWPDPAHAFTDMHDWGDLLVRTGFAEPVMDMERITLTFEGPERAVRELRQLGRNLHPARWGALRGRGWYGRMLEQLTRHCACPDGGVALEFEIIYGHAIKPPPRMAVRPETAVPLDSLRETLRRGRGNPGRVR